IAARGRDLVGQYGCARCHQGAYPAVKDPPPGPSLADAGRRLSKNWVMNWLADPALARTDAHMPRLFADDRAAFVERWIITEQLLAGGGKRTADAPPGTPRNGRLVFLGVGCATCHVVPDIDRKEQKNLGQVPFVGLADRLSASDIVAFLGNPHSRYPDG